MKRNIFLFGGGGKSAELKQFNNNFVEILKNNNINEVYFVPFGQKSFLYKQSYEKTIGFFNKKINFKLITNVERLINIDQKSDSIALYMAGGNVMRFAHIIRGIDYFGRYGKVTEENQILFANPNRINVEQYIVNFVNNGGFYYGTSAGAILAGKSLNTQMHETSNEDRINGLNVLNGYSVSPHYIEEKECLFYNNLERELNTRLIRLADNDGIYYNEEYRKIDKKVKKRFIEKNLEYIRTVQNNMILLEINKDKLPFHIEDWEILQRGMQYNLGIFHDYTINDFNKADNLNLHHKYQHCYAESNIPNNISNGFELSKLDICKICCDIFSISQKFRNNPLTYLSNNVLPNNKILKKNEKEILFILSLLMKLNKN